MRYYPDACVIIYLIERRADFYDFCKQRFDQALLAGHTLVTSELARMECRVGPLKDDAADTLQDFDRFFSRSSHHWCHWDRAVFDSAVELRVMHKLKAIDALHLAAAIKSGCDEFWTNDTRLTSAAENRIRIINITQPTL